MTNKVWHYKVLGRGAFPFDMLRYDRCWPAHETESSKMYSRDSMITRTTDAIEMTGYNEPTVGRWQSFGWTVIDVRKGL